VYIAHPQWGFARAARVVFEQLGWFVLGSAQRAETMLLEPGQDLDLLLIDADFGGPSQGLQRLAQSGPIARVQLVTVSSVDRDLLERLARLPVHAVLTAPVSNDQLRASAVLALGRATFEQDDARRRAAGAELALQEIGEIVRRACGWQPPVIEGLDRVPGLDALSPREHQVLRALLAHRRPPAIARELGISPNTVRNHLKSIFGKVGVRSQEELLGRVLASLRGTDATDTG